MPKLSRTELLQKVQDWPAEKIVALTLWGEIRNGSATEVWNIANVIKNRVRGYISAPEKPDWFGEGWAGVCLAPAQFSCWWDAQQEHMLSLPEANTTYQRMLGFARRAINGSEPDPTGGATNYYTIDKPSYARVWPPTWAPAMIELDRDTKHVLLRDPAVHFAEDTVERTPATGIGPQTLGWSQLANALTQTGKVKEAAENLGWGNALPWISFGLTVIGAIGIGVWWYRRCLSLNKPWAVWLHAKLPKMPWELEKK